MGNVRLKDVDIIEMSGNTLQARLWGRVYLLEMESDAYREEFGRLVKLLDGRHTLAELCAAVRLPAGEVSTILDTLRNMSLTETAEVDPGGDPPEDYVRGHAALFQVFESSKTKSSAECRRRLYAQEVALVGGDLLADELARRLPEYGLRRVRRATLEESVEGPDGELVVVALSSYDHRETLAAVNRRCVDRGRTLLPVYCGDGVTHIGPTVVPGKTACLQCLELRLTSNVDNQEALESYRAFIKRQGRRYPDMPAHLTTISTFVMQELLRVATGYDQAKSYNGVLKLDLWGSEVRRSRVLRFPSCPVCSGRARRPKYDSYAFSAMLQQL